MFFPKYLGERLKLDTDIILLHGCFDSRLIPQCAVILLSNCQVGCNFANFVYSHPCIGHRFVSSLVTERSILVNVRSTLDMFSKFCYLPRKMHIAQKISWVKGSVCFVLTFTFLPFSPLLPSGV